LKSPGKEYLKNFKEIGDTVEAGEKVGEFAGIAVKTAIRGVLRGLIHPGVPVSEGMKIGDVDPRNEKSSCFTICRQSPFYFGRCVGSYAQDPIE
jgi:xanthine dehydrogenase accessory factor